MKLSDFDYELPADLIASAPAVPRDHSRLLVLDRRHGALTHRRFFNIIDYLKKGDVLVLNNSKVIPARLIGRKTSGGAAELFLSRRAQPALSDYKKWRLQRGAEIWECLLKGKRLQAGAEIMFNKNFSARLLEKRDDIWLALFNKKGEQFKTALRRYGQTPLPPYIPARGKDDRKDYQTVYAAESKAGSVAAPTAGLHFTPSLLAALRKKGVIIKYLTLHVGLGTFLPVRVEDPRKHRMHAEWVEVAAATRDAILQAKKKKHRVIAVGTTSARSLEAAFSDCTFFSETSRRSFRGWVDIFIYPPYKFKALDGLVTNFHLPKSTLLMLVSALAGRERIMRAYAEAVHQGYRFYSYGDAMLIM